MTAFQTRGVSSVGEHGCCGGGPRGIITLLTSPLPNLHTSPPISRDFLPQNWQAPSAELPETGRSKSACLSSIATALG